MKIPILMYHQIDVPPPRGIRLRGLVVHPRSFAWQMALLRLLGFKGLSMRDLEPYLAGTKTGRVVGLTFDDGYQNNLLHALPVLKRHGFTATCYGVSAMMGGANVWDRDQGIAQKPLMTQDDWQQWVAAGMDVGSHTCNHVDLTAVPTALAEQEIRESKLALEAALGCEVRHFCYPYGRYAPDHPALVQTSGYATATTTHRGRVHNAHNPYALNRIMVARACNPILFAAKILSGYEDARG